MKNIANVIIFALLISLLISVSKNHVLLKDITVMQDYMAYSADQLKEANDHKEKYNWSRARLLKKTIFAYQSKIDLFTEEGILVDEYFESIKDNQRSTNRFYLEKERRSKLDELTPYSLNGGFSKKYIHPRLGFNDELHIGYIETILDNCKYEVFINGVQKETNSPGIYKCPTAPKLQIDINKIFINPNNQNLDTICVSKMISRA